MSIRMKSFEFASDDTFADATDVVINEGSDVLKIGAINTVLSEAQSLVDAITELLGQPVDGVIDTEKTLAGSGLVINYDPTASTVKIGMLGPMPTVKIEALVAGLQAFVLA